MRTSRFTLSTALLLLGLFTFITKATPTTLRSPTCPVEITRDPPAETSSVREAQISKIINGDKLSPALVPYMVLIAKGCTGTLISSKWFISAAHCKIEVGDKVFIGVPSFRETSPENERNVSRAFNHPEYVDIEKGIGDEFDFGVFELDSPAPYGSKFMKVNDNNDAPSAKSFARVMGYGRTTTGVTVDPVARQVDLPITTIETCEERNGALVGGIKENKQFCAGYDKGGCDSCQGDDGGPIIQYYRIEPVHAGVFSFGAGCADADQPGVYVRTAAYVNFLEENGVEFERISLSESVGLAKAFGFLIGTTVGINVIPEHC